MKGENSKENEVYQRWTRTVKKLLQREFQVRTCSLDELKLPEKHIRFIQNYFKNVAKESYVDRIILFGSCAKGNANTTSDIDLFVITKTVLEDDSEEIYYLLYKSTENIPLSEYVCCDILTATADDIQQCATPLIRAILREGVELHGVL